MVQAALAVDRDPPLAVVRLASPETGNRIGGRLMDDLRQTMAALADDSTIRAVILTGSDRVFSLGWDLAWLEEEVSTLLSRRSTGVFGATFQFLAESPLPVVAAINGDALSAGFELALACDLRLAATGARVGFPDVAEARLPMGGGTQRLARIAGRAVALEMIMLAESIDADAALQRGVVSSVVEPDTLADRALQIATTIASRGPVALRLAKEAVHHGLDMPLAQALRLETDYSVLLQTTTDRAEGVRAFIEKRPPHFQGR